MKILKLAAVLAGLALVAGPAIAFVFANPVSAECVSIADCSPSVSNVDGAAHQERGVEAIRHDSAMLCDLDGDYDVDRNDISIVTSWVGQASPPAPVNADWDGNGVINLSDQRGCVLLCTRARCATS